MPASRPNLRLGAARPPVWPATEPADPRAAFARERADELTVGLEEELHLVDPRRLELARSAPHALERAAGDPRFAAELKESQLELVTRPHGEVGSLARELAGLRLRALELLADEALIVASGTHPFSARWDDVARGDRYAAIAHEYAWAVKGSVPAGLHVHVAVAGADRALALYNALRGYLPDLQALAANSPFLEGRDTGLAAVRPLVNATFLRSGVPPAFATWRELDEYVRWGVRGGMFPDASHLWWDLRLHLRHGTLELRATDVQTRVDDAAAVAAVFRALAAWLLDRLDAGERLHVPEPHRVAENARRAVRYGVRAEFADLATGEREPVRTRLLRLLDEAAPAAERLGSLAELTHARTLVAENGAERQRYVAARAGLHGLVGWLAEQTRESARDLLAA
ncbi:MAG TPA: YbdK family carboxylate-amine ligase [Gaiellaceae bacterium]|nr:YbdK family carboxylate-amine ligase [Gaiellaceae bacterium]